MKFVRFVAIVALSVALAALAGCSSKKEKDAAVAPVAPLQKPAAIVAPPQDKIDAAAVATTVLAQIKSGEFAAIYKAASPIFKEMGAEDGFVAMMEKTRKKTGPFISSKEVSFVTSPEKFNFIIYHVQYKNIASELRLTTARSKSGKMELCGLNQKDIRKK
ncbi:MAG: hypothetical protein JJE30_01085 [Desulfuromonadales bacterium]|nr:hypothetical protein [Desulfuromonadales bacterium]